MKDAVFDELTDGPVNEASSAEQMEADTDNELLLHEIISQSLATLLRCAGHCTLSYRIFLISWNREEVEKGGTPTISS